MICRIRKACSRDLDTMILLFRGTVEHINSRDYTDVQIAAWLRKASRERWEELWHDDLVFWVAEDEDHKIAGFASVDMRGYLHSMYVHYAFQRSGVASVLLKQVERFCLQHNLRVLTSDVSITARPFFERKGFRVIREQQVDIDGALLTNFSMEKIVYSFKTYAGRIPACGVFCGGCPTYVRDKDPCPGATINNVRCEACKTFHLCCKEKGITHCHQCETFPCRRFRSFAGRWLKYGQDFIQNQYALKRTGEKEFLKMYNSKADKP